MYSTSEGYQKQLVSHHFMNFKYFNLHPPSNASKPKHILLPEVGFSFMGREIDYDWLFLLLQELDYMIFEGN